MIGDNFREAKHTNNQILGCVSFVLQLQHDHSMKEKENLTQPASTIEIYVFLINVSRYDNCIYTHKHA